MSHLTNDSASFHAAPGRRPRRFHGVKEKVVMAPGNSRSGRPPDPASAGLAHVKAVFRMCPDRFLRKRHTHASMI